MKIFVKIRKSKSQWLGRVERIPEGRVNEDKAKKDGGGTITEVRSKQMMRLFLEMEPIFGCGAD